MSGIAVTDRLRRAKAAVQHATQPTEALVWKWRDAYTGDAEADDRMAGLESLCACIAHFLFPAVRPDAEVEAWLLLELVHMVMVLRVLMLPKEDEEGVASYHDLSEGALDAFIVRHLPPRVLARLLDESEPVRLVRPPVGADPERLWSLPARMPWWALASSDVRERLRQARDEMQRTQLNANDDDDVWMKSEGDATNWDDVTFDDEAM